MSFFPERLKELRTSAGLTLKSLATKMNVSHVSYLRWEQGKTEPSIESIILLCKIFDVSSDYLIGIEKDTVSAPQYPTTLPRKLHELQTLYEQLNEKDQQKVLGYISRQIEENKERL